MRLRVLVGTILTGLLLLMPALWTFQTARAAPSRPPALQGQVRSDAEGAMEGVLVSAKLSGGNRTITVVTNAQGRYSFPGDRLQAGTYVLRTRAAGYRSAAGQVEVTGGKTASQDLKLDKITDNLELASQLTATEWVLTGIPAIEKATCAIGCHNLERIMKKTADIDAWEATLHRMRAHSQIEGARTRPEGFPEPPRNPADRKLAAELSKIAGADKLKSYNLKLLPRPKGDATKVVITQYDLPDAQIEPHDVAVRNERVWWGDFAGPLVGLLDSRTGEDKTYTISLIRPGYPINSVDIEIDREGNPWFALMWQGAIGKLDRKTGKWTTWSVPKQYMIRETKPGMLGIRGLDNTGLVWFKETAFNQNLVFKVNTKTNEITGYYPFGKQVDGASGQLTPHAEVGKGDEEGKKGHGTYGVTADRAGNGYFNDIDGGNIVKIDAKSGKITLYPTPTPDSGPRRGEFDEQDHLWFAEYNASKVGMFDPRTEKFEEWPIPQPSEHPYDVIKDKNGDLWGGGMWNDFVFRFNPKTGAWTQYLLPSINTNIRRVDVDNSTTPVTFWIGENHHGKITKIEPLE